jgi:putative transposase
MNLARFIGNLKTVSSRYMRKKFANHLKRFFWKTRFWNSAYAVVSAGGHASSSCLPTSKTRKRPLEGGRACALRAA